MANTQPDRSVLPLCNKCGERPRKSKRATLCARCYKRAWRRRGGAAVERDRAASAGWKRDHPDEAYALTHDACACGHDKRRISEMCGNCRRESERKHRDARRTRIAELWQAQASLREIAVELESTSGSVAVEINRMRGAGWDLPMRIARKVAQ
jgi:hypothetical protein